MKKRIDDLFEGASFRLEGETHTIRRIENGRVWCEREDVAIVPLSGHLQADEWTPRRTFGQWFSAVLP